MYLPQSNLQCPVIALLMCQVLAGPTVIIDQRYNNSLGEAVPQEPSRCVLLWPHKDAFSVFNGGLAHGVLDSSCSQKRATMLINWWKSQPQAFSSPEVSFCNTSKSYTELQPPYTGVTISLGIWVGTRVYGCIFLGILHAVKIHDQCDVPDF